MAVAVIVTGVSLAVLPVTTPSLTVATLVSLDDQVNLAFVGVSPPTPVTLALIVNVLLTSTVFLLSAVLKLIDATLTFLLTVKVIEPETPSLFVAVTVTVPAA